MNKNLSDYFIHRLEEGQKLQLAGNYGKAEAVYFSVLDEVPDDTNAIFLLATLYQQQEKYSLAIALYNKLLKNNAGIGSIHNNLGGCYHRICHDAKARDHYLTANKLTGGKDRDVLSNLAGMYVNTGNPSGGDEYFKKLFELYPDHIQGNWNYSLSLLEREEFAKGWYLYEYGIKSGDRKNKKYPVEEWDGRDCDKVVVCGEQGIGDEVMFSSLFMDMSQHVKTIIYDCHPRLAEMMEYHNAHNFCDFIVRPSRKDRDVDWVKDEGVEFCSNIGSLGRFYRRSKEDFQNHHTYITLPEKDVNEWKNRLNEYGKGIKVGISWFGGTKKTRSDLRSIPLQALLPLLDIPGIVWINAQYNIKEEELNEFERLYGIKIHHPVGEDDYYDWTVKNYACDFHVSVCNSLVHTMGAMGKKVFCMVPKAPAWRYGLKDNKMVWYDSVELIRQKHQTTWGDVIVETLQKVEAEVVQHNEKDGVLRGGECG